MELISLLHIVKTELRKLIRPKIVTGSATGNFPVMPLQISCIIADTTLSSLYNKEAPYEKATEPYTGWYLGMI